MNNRFLTIGIFLALSVWMAFVPWRACAAPVEGGYASASLLSAGKWVKIKIRHSGIHQITDSELRGMGFDNPGAVAVYGYPVAALLADNRLTPELPDDLPPVPSARYGDKLVFYGEGDVSLSVSEFTTGGVTADFVDVKRNYFADYGTYFLTDSHPRAEMQVVPFSVSDFPAVSVSFGMAHFEEEVQNPGETGARYLGANFMGAGFGEWMLGMPAFNGEGNVNLRLLAGVRLDDSSRLYVTLSGSPRRGKMVFSRSGDTYAYGSEEFAYSVGDVVPRPDGLYPVRCEFSGTPEGLAALEYVTALYPRGNTLAGEPQSVFVFGGDAACGNAEFSDGGRALAFWNITRRGAPVALEAQRCGEDKTAVSLRGGAAGRTDGGREYVVAFDPEATLLPVEAWGEATCADLHSASTPHMLVVASRDFMPQAERLARLHRETDGIDVEVVAQENVYNEFSSGTPHLMAIRRLARMFHDRAPHKFRSILLFGPAHYDSRGLMAEDAEWFRNHYLPMFICEDFSVSGHINRSYSTDAFVGMLDDDAGVFDVAGKKMTVAVGRIPATSAEDADDYLAKLERYVSALPSEGWHTRAAIICDSGNDNGHMADADGLAAIIGESAPWTTVVKAYNTVYPLEGGSARMLRRSLVSALSQGVCFLGYSGHGSPTVFAPEELWGVGMAERTEYDTPPFAMFASCRSLYIDHPGRNTGTIMLFKNRGGAIAVVGSVREVYKTENQVLNLCVGAEFFGGDAMTLGEVFRRARNSVAERAAEVLPGSDIRKLWHNTLCYNLAGDPEIGRNSSGRRMELTHVAGVGLAAGARLSVPAGKGVPVEGCVTLPTGEVDAGFHGRGVVAVFDGRKEKKVVNGTAAEKAGSTFFDEDLIYEKCFRIDDGRFSGDLWLPLPGCTDGGQRISMYAVSDDGRHIASGWLGALSVTPFVEGYEPGDDTVPVISAMYLDHEGFVDGDVVGCRPVVYAEVAPNEIGVAGMSAQIGKSVSLSLDGGKQRIAGSGICFHIDEHGGGRFECRVGTLTDGRHRLTLKVSNYAGQSASRTVSFTVIGQDASALLAVDEYPSVSGVTFRLEEHTFPSEPAGRIVIADAAGRVVFTDAEATFPYRWNLADGDGAEVPEGVYEATAYLHGGNAYGSATPVRVVVLRR